MAKKLKQPKNRPQRPDRLPSTFIIQSIQARGKKQIDDWRSALRAAENHENPRRNRLNSIYDEIVIDSHLTSQWDLVRKLRTQGSKWNIYAKDGQPDQDKTYLIKKPWFIELCSLLLDSIAYGHSLIQFDRIEPLGADGSGGIKEVSLVHRNHVVPEHGLLLKRESDQTGISYREDPRFQGYIIESPKKKELGFLNKAVPHVLYKRFASAGMSELAEIIGVPPRVGKTNTRDKEMVDRMEEMLANMGSSFYSVIDDSENIDFLDPSNSKGELHERIAKMANHEMSKLINAFVVGEVSAEGSKSKEEIGERYGIMVAKADKEYLEGIINESLIPILIQHGYPLQDCYFGFEEVMDLTVLFDIVEKLLARGYEIDMEWIIETFGVPVVGFKQPASDPEGKKPAAKSKPAKAKEDQKKPEQLSAEDDFFD